MPESWPQKPGYHERQSTRDPPASPTMLRLSGNIHSLDDHSRAVGADRLGYIAHHHDRPSSVKKAGFGLRHGLPTTTPWKHRLVRVAGEPAPIRIIDGREPGAGPKTGRSCRGGISSIPVPDSPSIATTNAEPCYGTPGSLSVKCSGTSGGGRSRRVDDPEPMTTTPSVFSAGPFSDRSKPPPRTCSRGKQKMQWALLH